MPGCDVVWTSVPSVVAAPVAQALLTAAVSVVCRNPSASAASPGCQATANRPAASAHAEASAGAGMLWLVSCLGIPLLARIPSSCRAAAFAWSWNATSASATGAIKSKANSTGYTGICSRDFSSTLVLCLQQIWSDTHLRLTTSAAE